VHFVHESLPQRVRFATGGAPDAVRAEVDRLDARRVMVMAGPAAAALAEKVTSELSPVLRHDEVVMHVPVEVAQRARAAAAAHRVDAIVAVGGGSTTGLAKAVALTTGVPIVAVPTTFAGSEATAVWGLTEAGRKTTGIDPVVLCCVGCRWTCRSPAGSTRSRIASIRCGRRRPTRSTPCSPPRAPEPCTRGYHWSRRRRRG
jgi:alcohol dehydrogenase class IV